MSQPVSVPYYIAVRFAQSAVTLLLLASLVFVLARVLGDPVTFMLPLDAGEEEIAQLRAEFGLDKPILEQYLSFLGGLFQGDLGVSIRQREPVNAIIVDRLWPSISLALLAVAWAFVASVLLAAAAAMNRGTAADKAVNFIATVGQSLPSFWLALVLVQLFSVQFGWFPAAGQQGWSSYVLPALTLGVVALAGLVRLLRSSLLEVLESDFVVRARAMGLSENRILFRHALPNAILPAVTYAGEVFAALIAAGVAVEVVFAWPGLGRLAYDAVFVRDYPVLQGVVIVAGAIILLTNLVVDLMYLVLDPRIRL